ncbi:hypothetical protein [Achromobacter sp. DH1f]|uniref:hypothetical protein n=1 Tax=Achromobacter sp. DH1f TaxID=1397275 RepID=UPI00046A0C4C|nr:hypothetical protein [Achromobacter sp. DH1f]
MDALTLLKSLQNAGCEFAVQVPGIGGVATRVATAEQALRLPQDKQGVFAELMGLEREEYLLWQGDQGAVYCSGTTTKGMPCRQYIVGARHLAPQSWKAQRAAGGYCAVHGGSR